MMKTLLFAVIFTIWQISASAILNIKAEIDCDGYLCLPSRHLVRRSVRSKCSPPTRPTINSREFVAHQHVSNTTLWRRVMNPPAADDTNAIGTLVFDQTESAPDENLIVWENQATKSDVNTSLFRSLNTREVSLATTRLQGCTVLAIISRRGVYFGHYWESIAFDPDKLQLDHIDVNDMEWTETPDEIFVRTVIDGLKKGIARQQESLARSVPLLADDHVTAYLVRPRYSQAKERERDTYGDDAPDPLPDGYPEHWQRMKDEVVRLIPKISEPGRWNEVIYEATDDQVTLAGTHRGRLLFRYDPRSLQTTTRGEPPTRMSMLWSEAREVHRDTWK